MLTNLQDRGLNKGTLTKNVIQIGKKCKKKLLRILVRQAIKTKKKTISKMTV